MAKERSDGKDALDTQHLISVGALGVGVLLVLVLGAWLEADRGTPESEAQAAPQAAAGPRTPAPALEVFDEPAAAPSAPSGSLHARALRDRQRLAGSGDAFLLQLAVMCDPDNVRRALAEHDADASLLILPARVAGRECHRICYGPYPSRAQALGAEGLPPGLRALGEPQVRNTAEVLQ